MLSVARTSVFFLSACAAASNVNIYHRILIPGAPELPFVERGVIYDSRFQSSSSSSQHWLDFENALEGLSSAKVDLDRVLYQISLEREGADRDVSSVKLCHLPLISSESIILHIPHSAQTSAPHAIDYFVVPIPDDGACPRLGSGPAATLASPFQALSKLNMTIIHRPATLPPLPQLRTPPQLTAEGAPVQPPPEKSFIQKYWMYIVAVLFALLMTSGPPEEEGQSRAGR